MLTTVVSSHIGSAMNSYRTYLGLLLIAFYLIFPGNGLAFVNHIFHDRGLPEIDCPCRGETERHAAHPLDGNEDDDAGTRAMECACSSHIPLTNDLPEHDRISARVPIGKPLNFPAEIYLPIFVPPQNPAA